MTDQAIVGSNSSNIIEHPAMRKLGQCRDCGCITYTVAELNLAPDQDWSCYYCLEDQRRYRDMQLPTR